MFDNETERPTWVADLLFQRANRTNRNYADGSPLFFADFENGLFWSQFLENLSLLLFYLVSLSLNTLLFAMSITKPNKSKRKKLPCLIANLALCNIILCTGFVIYTLVLDVYLETDSLESLIEQIENTNFRSWVWIGREIIHIQLIENMIFAQSIIVLFISFDRYCSLFPNYSPYVKKPWLMLVISTLPYFNSHVLLSYEILDLEFESPVSIGLRTVALMIPPPLALVLTVCAIIRLKQGGIIYRSSDIAAPCTVLIILILQFTEKTGILYMLLEANFGFEVVIGDRRAEEVLQSAISIWKEASRHLCLWSPLYIAVLFLTVSRHYRSRIIGAVKKLFGMCCGRRDDKVDYSSETMRSIIADQNRARRLKSFRDGV
ncbi:hypothetical protein QR680_018604 [Steinernema hermaphroditum]|uniref:G-protein coupled receptors family 1 profile domain-containing protein n=1 Tax=Steinernema hermaphroditum TaxID=289476 RepID=A0AA39HII1_9BILA|nr:hypothetical protein QR680_018604 [Steinernema hermaphroditum]